MKKFPLGLIFALVFFGWMLLSSLISIYPNFLWFAQLGFASVFWTNLWAKTLTGLGFGLLFLVIAGLNIFVAKKLTPERQAREVERPASQFDLRKMIQDMFGEGVDPGPINITPGSIGKKQISFFWVIGLVVISFFMGLSAITQWQVVLKALNAVAFGVNDPVFNQDISFYLFQLPLHRFAQGFIFSTLILSLIAVVWNYLTSGAVNWSGFGNLKVSATFTKGVKTHLALLLAVIAVVFAWGLWLGSLEILYSARGVVYGAGYTDVKAQLLGYNLQIFMILLVAGLFIINIFQKDYRLPLVGVASYFVLAVVMGGVYPAIVQNLQVNPSEISMEAPYISNGIKFTRLAYGLDNVEEKEFAADQNLSLADIRRNSQTVNNIRLWDPRPLIKTYRQLQGIRLYYDFDDVDVDRYQIG
ncbi:MAG: UPF0182 family protein, partial [bacterium]